MRAVLIAILVLLAAPLAAQGRFDPVATVNADVVTRYELDQRIQLLRALRAQGDLRTLALDQLIEDRLRTQAARAAGIGLADEGVRLGMEQFAQRANLSLEQFERVLRGSGVAEGTLRAFVEPQLLWREVIRARFGSRGTVSEAEIDRAIGQQGNRSGLRVLLNEIILPARPNVQGEVARARANAARLSRIRSIGAFQAEAASLSVSQSRTNRGRLDWLNLSELPPPLQPVIRNLRPGEVTEPIEIENAVVLFQLRRLEEVAVPPPPVAAIDYATIQVPADRAAGLRDRVDTCDDLYGVARRDRLPRAALQRQSQAPAAIPRDLALELAKLDAGEGTFLATRAVAGSATFVMLCARTNTLNADADRGAVADRLRQQRLAGYADSFLAELRADAVIRR
ncbi:MAG: SurA N-terminal domain-containing protein [Shimia sp.]